MALRHLVANFADPAVGAVTGEMRLFPGRGGEQADMDLYWRYERWARTVHSQIDSIFASTGCIMAIRRNLVPPIPEDTLSDDAIVPLRAFLKGYRVVYDPAAIATDYPAETSTEFRRRCRNLAGLWQVFVCLPALLGWNNRMWFHFMSHKFGRLLLPWSLLLQVLAGFAFPPSPVRTALLGAELLFVLLLLADLLVPERSRLKRFTSPARTFLTMNAASVAAMRVFFVSPTKLWIPTRVETRANE
jgi:cellulose synthase/poly-beta-1,6-N-acetylglucosamine synthase-like glycosyltransferase